MDRKKIPKDFEENRTRVGPLLNETPPTLPTLPSAANWRVDFRTQSDPTHVGIVSCGGRTGRIHGVRAMWDSRANGETPMVGLLAGYIGN